jgi:hypothetical protein
VQHLTFSNKSLTARSDSPTSLRTKLVPSLTNVVPPNSEAAAVASSDFPTPGGLRGFDRDSTEPDRKWFSVRIKRDAACGSNVM